MRVNCFIVSRLYYERVKCVAPMSPTSLVKGLNGHTSRDVEFDDLFLGNVVQELDECADAVPVRCNQDTLPAL